MFTYYNGFERGSFNQEFSVEVVHLISYFNSKLFFSNSAMVKPEIEKLILSPVTLSRGTKMCFSFSSRVV